MHRTTITTLLTVVTAAPMAFGEQTSVSDGRSIFADAPSGFIPPPLHPSGATLHTKQLSEGVYALISDKPPVDNAGFVVGERGVLVIDSHINGAMAGQILDAVRAVTAKPILYLVNTNYHGDHTFGNSTFPQSTSIIAHEKTYLDMVDFELERGLILTTVNGDNAVLDGVILRLPDITFDDSLNIDLGGRVVELRYFGKGNTAGDTVVFVPEAGVAWTGNLVVGQNLVPILFEYGADQYLPTITRLSTEIDVRTIIPGHGFPLIDNAPAHLNLYINYLSDLLADVGESIDLGRSRDETINALDLDERFLPDIGSPAEAFTPVLVGFHKNNIANTYRDLIEKQNAAN